MKRLILIPILFIAITLSATTYYVATPSSGGNDSNPGTLAQPWASWNEAFTSTSVQPGDTVFFRGGVYQTTVVTGLGIRPTRNGTVDNWIVYINYPGEVPILDCGNITTGDIVYSGLRNDGISIRGIEYIKLFGLTVRNVKQYYDRNYARGIYIENGIVIIENCKTYNCWGHGMHSEFTEGANESSTHYIINCDSYNNCDSISGNPLGSNAGATGAGFDAWDGGGTNGKAYFYNCRAWGNSDQGWSIPTEAYVKCEGCWSFANKAYGKGGGAGFKMGWQDINLPNLRREMINCVATYNDGYGFFTNEKGSDPPYIAVKSNHFNNIAYHNGGFGFTIQDTEQADEIEQWRNYSNNISYLNTSGAVYNAAGAAKYSGSNNTWDIPLTVADADFASLDTTGITAPRQADGSLPDNDCYHYFLRLASSSDLIDAGVDVGLPYGGTAPDLGAFEYDLDETATDILTFTLADQTGAATINTTNHTVAIEVSYTADITDLTPTITLSYGATIDPLSGVSQDFTSPVTYTVTALDEVTEQEWVVTVTQEEEPVDPPTSSSKIVKLGGLILKL